MSNIPSGDDSPPPLNLNAVRRARGVVQQGAEGQHTEVLYVLLRDLLGAYDSLAARLAVLAVERTAPVDRTEVERIARQATCHTVIEPGNYGQTVFGSSRGADGSVTVHMSSWPRAREATEALRRAGYDATHIGDTGVLVRGRS